MGFSFQVIALKLVAMKTQTFIFSLTLGISAFVYGAEDWQKFPIGPFGTLNNRDSSYAIGATQSSDLLNVDLTPGGKSVRKRKGYGIAFTLAETTSPAHGVYDFFDSGGSEVNLFFNDNNLTASVGGGAATVLISSGPNGATYQCTDSLGQAYCANTSRTQIIKTDGTNLAYVNTVASTGTMLATAVTRLAMAGFANSPSRIDLSAENDFTSWGSGSAGTSPAQFTINAPGAKITHIVYAFNRLMWFKDTSFGYILIGNQPFQSDWVIKTVSYDVGTNDNSSIYREGILYFRGKDGHIYLFDGNSYQRLSREISGTINQAQTRVAGTWAQTSQADFSAGVSSADLSIAQVSGSVISKTTWYILTSSSDWGSSVLNPVLYVDTQTVNGNFQATFPDEFTALRDGTLGTKPVYRKSGTVSVSGGNLLLTGSSFVASQSSFSAIQTGTTFYFKLDPTQSTSAGFDLRVSSRPDDTASFTNGMGFQLAASGSSDAFYMTSSCGNGLVQSGFRDSCVAFGDTAQHSSYVCTPTFPSFPNSSDVNFFVSKSTFQVSVGTTVVAYGTHTCTLNPPYAYLVGSNSKVDKFGVFPQTFTVSTPGLDTGIVIPKYSTFTITSGGGTNGTLSFTSQVSADNITFDSAVALSSGGAVSSLPKRYAKINTSYTTSNATDSVLSVSAMDFVAGSSGTFLSQVHAAPNLSVWDTFGVSDVQNDGTITYYTRARQGVFTVLDSTPAWVLTAKNSIPTTSTGTYMQARADFVARSSGTVRLDDFAFNWFEGSATDKMYAIYFDDKLLFSLPIGTGTTTNNKVLLYDTLNQGWLVYDLASNGFYVKANKLYFGSATSGYVFKFGDVSSDNGAAINSYWKSKDYFGGDPFTTQELANISLAAKAVSNSSTTVTYTLNGSSSTSYVMPLSSSKSFISNNKNLPAGTVGSTFNLQFGNNAVDQEWELFGAQIGIRPKSWIPGLQ